MNSHLPGITGHKSTESVRRYVRKRRDQEKQRISDVLQNQMNGDTSIAKQINLSDDSTKINCIGKEMAINF